MSTADQATNAPKATAASASAAAPIFEITLAVSALEDLFNAPAVNPFVDRDLRAIGEPAINRAIHQLEAAGRGDHRAVRLRVQAPANLLPSDTEVARAINRYCTAKIADNNVSIHVTQRRARRGLEISVVVVLLFGFVAYTLLVTVLANAGEIIQGIVEGSLSVFAWVVLWDTLEALLFNPLPAKFENHALTRLLSAEMVIEALSADDTSAHDK